MGVAVADVVATAEEPESVDEDASAPEPVDVAVGTCAYARRVAAVLGTDVRCV